MTKENSITALSTTSLILGIFSIISFFFLPGCFLIICSIVGIVIGIIARKKEKNWLNLIGIILSALSIAIFLITIIIAIASVNTLIS